jgi:predicted transglutaminase-like cysteine proteinase
MADNIGDINKQIDDLRKLLNQRPIQPFDQRDLEMAKTYLSGLRNELREMNSDLNYIAQSFKDSVAELSKQNLQLTIARNSLKGISNIARDVVDYRKGEVDLSEKQLKNLQRQAKLKFNDLQLTLRSGKLNQIQADEVRDALSQQAAFNAGLSRTIELQAEVNKDIGLMGVGLEGAGKSLEKLGFVGISKPITDAIQATKRARLEYKLNQDSIQDIGKEMQTLNTRNLSDAQIRYGFGGRELKNLLAQKETLEAQNKELDKETNKYKNIASAIKEQITLTNMTDAIIAKTVDSFFKLDEAQTKFQNLTGGTIPLMDQMNTRLITSVDYIQTAATLTQQTGMNAAAIFTPDTLAAASEMVKSMGMTQEQANKAAIMSQVNGQTIDQMNDSIKQGTKEHNATNRSALAQGAIMREVYNTSTAIASSLGNSTKRITEAVSRAKDLGLSLAEVDNIANSLLNVEQSIASEFEYEVISGKQINLEAARYYALTNQTEKLTAEIGKNQSIINSFASGNRIEQEAAAKALGISRDQLAEMYIADQRKAKLTDAEIAKNMQMEEGDIRRLSVQESINTSINKMTELLAGPLEMFTTMLSTILKFKIVLVAVTSLIAGRLVFGLVTSAAALAAQVISARAYNAALNQGLAKEAALTAMKVAGAEAVSFGAVTAAIVAGLAIVGTAIAGYSMMKDGEIDPKKGPVMTGEFGSVQLDPKDKAMYSADGKIKVGTNLIPNTTVTQQTLPQPTTMIDYERLGAHLAQAMSKVQVQTNLDGVSVSRGLQAPMGIATRKI